MILLSITLLALTTTPSWTYAGFVADPEPFPPARPAVTPPAPSSRVNHPSSPPEPKGPPVVPPIPPVVMAPAARVIRYRLADGSGQLWEHADPTVLQTFVQDRNQQVFGFGRFVVPDVASTWR